MDQPPLSMLPCCLLLTMGTNGRPRLVMLIGVFFTPFAMTNSSDVMGKTCDAKASLAGGGPTDTSAAVLACTSLVLFLMIYAVFIGDDYVLPDTFIP